VSPPAILAARSRGLSFSKFERNIWLAPSFLLAGSDGSVSVKPSFILAARSMGLRASKAALIIVFGPDLPVVSLSAGAGISPAPNAEALNHERAAEEKRGVVRWLRPAYQIPKLGIRVPKAESEHVGMLDIELMDVAERLKWPTDGLEQIRLVRDLLAKAPAPTPSDDIAGVFDGRNTAKRRERVSEVLETLVATGLARTGEHEGQRRYFLPR
jgi:hypothetical protein